MLLAYCQLVLGISAVISLIHVTSPVNSASTDTNPAVRQTARYDPDNESLGPPYNLHVVVNGSHDDGVTSRRHDDGCHGATEIPASQAVVAEDFYHSNSV